MTTATIRVVITAIAVWAAASWVPGIAVDVGDTGTAGAIAIYLVVGAVLALVNAYVKPVVTLLSLPLLILTLGLFYLVVNALMLGLTAWLTSWLDFGLIVDGFGAAVLGAIVVAVCRWCCRGWCPGPGRAEQVTGPA